MNRKYLQFNDLVIDDFDMLSSADLSGGFKRNSIEYGFGNGSYAPFKSASGFSAEQSLSLELKFDKRKNRCNLQRGYRDFIAYNLSRPGRLWAIQDDQLLWAWAYVGDFSQVYAYERNFFSMDVDFNIYEGVWHKADKRKTFLKPYSSCDYLEDLNFKEADLCENCCTSCILKEKDPCPSCVSECEFLTKEDSLCGMGKDALKDFWNSCGGAYKILYNCAAAEKLWGEKALGQKICKKESCRNMIAGQFYSDTVLDTDGVTITLFGAFYNPEITINKNTMMLKGEFDGRITIDKSGNVYYKMNECCDEIMLDLEDLIIPEGSTFGYNIHHGNNSVLIDTKNCCDMACAYIYVDSITT